MIQQIFYEIERNPHRVVNEREMLNHFTPEFHQWRKLRLVVRVPVLEPGNYYADNKNRMLLIVENKDGTMEGIDEDDPEADPVPLAAEDLVGWKLDLHVCAAEFHRASDLRGRPGPLGDRLFFLGEKLYENSKIAVVLGLFDSDSTALQSMRSLSSLVSDAYRRFVVVCPSYAPSPQVERELSSLDIGVIQMSGDAPFVLDLDVPTCRPRVRGRRIVLDDDQEREFQHQGFNYRLPIHVTALERARNSTLVLVDSNELSLPLAPFRLFVWLLTGLFQQASGLVAWDELRYSTDGLLEESIVPEGIDQALGRLRRRFESPVGSKLKGTKFIEQKRRHVRLSTHRRYVTYDLQGLLAHSDTVVRILASRLPDDPNTILRMDHQLTARSGRA